MSGPSRRPQRATCIPSSASASAIAWPIPRAAPVTRAVRIRAILCAPEQGEGMDLTDVRYEVEDGLAWITIDRPDRMNSFRARTVDELIACFKRAWADKDVGVTCLTGAGDRAFCTGGDQKQRAETGDYGPSESGLFEVEYLHRLGQQISQTALARA